mgnify:CR=1 FL=1
MQTDGPAAGWEPLSVIVLNWNLPGDTIACVRSLQRGLLAGSAIIIVDNASSDDSLRQFGEVFGDQVMVVALESNRGFAGGMNAGIEAALQTGAGSVLLLNNDTIADGEMIARLREAAVMLPRAGILGPAIYYYDAPARLWQAGTRRSALLPVPVNLGGAALRRARGRPLRVDAVTGCAMLVRREVFARIGLFDSRYAMYYEDADFCYRARAAGFEIWCVPRARMWHRVSLSARQVPQTTRAIAAWGRARFYRQYPHGPFPGLTLAFLLAQAALGAARDYARGDAALARLRWRATLDGYALRPLSVALPQKAGA